MPLPTLSLSCLKKWCINIAFTAIQPISKRSALAKKTNLCIRYHTPVNNMPGTNAPIPKPINTEFFTFLNIKRPGI